MTTNHRVKAVFNWSGGKDSALALHKALSCGKYEIISLLTTINSDNKRSSMHAIPESLIDAQARSIGIPIHYVPLKADGSMGDYEKAMTRAVDHFKAQGVTHFIFGDIFLQDVRSYREAKLAPYGIEVIEPLWNMTTEEVISDFLSSGLKTIIVTTMADVLGAEYIGRVIDKDFISSLPEGVDPCGENGEYHTFCYDGPIFSEPVRFSIEEKLKISHEVGMEDGTRKTFSYWYARLGG